MILLSADTDFVIKNKVGTSCNGTTKEVCKSRTKPINTDPVAPTGEPIVGSLSFKNSGSKNHAGQISVLFFRRK